MKYEKILYFIGFISLFSTFSANADTCRTRCEPQCINYRLGSGCLELEPIGDCISEPYECENPGVITPPPPFCALGQFTKYTFGSWSTCNVGNNSWQADNSLKCTQTRDVSSSTVACGCPGLPKCQENDSQPSTTQESILRLSGSPISIGTPYADNRDILQVKIPINNIPLEGVNWNGKNNFTNFNSTNFAADRISEIGSNAITITGAFINNSIQINITSVAPINKSGMVSFTQGNKNFVFNNIIYHFLKPFTGKIEVQDIMTKQWNGIPSLGTIMNYRLGLHEETSLSKSTLEGYKIENFSDKIVPSSSDLDLQNTKLNETTLNTYSGTEFSTRMNTSSGAKRLNTSSGLQVNQPIISYILGGMLVKYYLSEKKIGDDMTPIKTSTGEFLGVRVIGGIQGGGKSEFTGQQTNISNLYNSEQRVMIRKNAYEYVKSMKSGDYSNGIKYILGDVNISDVEEDFETLVVINGNVIFNTNFLPSKLKGIIVLKDNYSVSKGEKVGNIYVQPKVTGINAIIYADGAVISVDSSNKVYQEDSLERTQMLKNQLILKGTLFTRNTIGGAILSGGYYLLPGGMKTGEFNKAMNFDLNYIRRGNSECEKKADQFTCIYKEPFVIKYDSRVQTIPPKLFFK